MRQCLTRGTNNQAQKASENKWKALQWIKFRTKVTAEICLTVVFYVDESLSSQASTSNTNMKNFLQKKIQEHQLCKTIFAGMFSKLVWTATFEFILSAHTAFQVVPGFEFILSAREVLKGVLDIWEIRAGANNFRE